MSRLRIDVHTHWLSGAIAAWTQHTSQQITDGYRISVRCVQRLSCASVPSTWIIPGIARGRAWSHPERLSTAAES
jgi:hypothetical protein